MIWRIQKYIQHLFYLSHRKGFGIHSPYLFEFVNKVLFNGAKVRVPAEILGTHRELKRDKTKIPDMKLGATSHVDPSGERSVASFVRHSSVSEKYGALLYRIVQWFKPDMIIELGSGLGISTLYLSSANPELVLHSVEGNSHRATFARRLLVESDLGLALVHNGEMGEELDVLMPQIKGRFVAFVDGNHRYEATLAYVRKLVDHLGPDAGEDAGEDAGADALIIMDDIYWSKEMFAAWNEIISWSGVRVNIDLYQMGILLLRRDLDKADIKIKF